MYNYATSKNSCRSVKHNDSTKFKENHWGRIRLIGSLKSECTHWFRER